jgi:ABC-type branched-subunit amino acid transport system substrate-binding protein
MLKSTKKIRVAAVFGAASLVFLAACSSSSSSSGSGGGASSGPAGTPITLGLVAPVASQSLSQPEREGAVKAAIGDINAKGGVNGHPLTYNFCDTKGDANGELTCMRQMVDAKVSAIVTPGTIFDQSGRGLKLASASGIPIVGAQGLTPLDFNLPGVFPLASGIPGWAYGTIVALLQSGATKIGLFGTNDAGSIFITQFGVDALAAAGMTPVNRVQVDQQADPTFASGAARVMAGGVDGIAVEASPTDVPKMTTALVNAGYKGKIAGITGAFVPADVTALGSKAEGLLLSSQTALVGDTANPAVAQFVADMKQYAPDAEVNETAMTTYASVLLYAQVMATATSFGPSDTLAAFNAISTPVDVGLAGPFAVVGVKKYLPAFPNMYNPSIVNGVVKNGVVVPGTTPGFINPFDALAALKK